MSQIFLVMQSLKRLPTYLFSVQFETFTQASSFKIHSLLSQLSDSVDSLISFQFEKELEPVINNISYFDALLRNYSRFDMTKLVLADNVSAETTTAVMEMLQTLNNRMELQAFDPVRNQIRNARKNFRDWWVLEFVL